MPMPAILPPATHPNHSALPASPVTPTSSPVCSSHPSQRSFPISSIDLSLSSGRPVTTPSGRRPPAGLRPPDPLPAWHGRSRSSLARHSAVRSRRLWLWMGVMRCTGQSQHRSVLWHFPVWKRPIGNATGQAKSNVAVISHPRVSQTREAAKKLAFDRSAVKGTH